MYSQRYTETIKHEQVSIGKNARRIELKETYVAVPFRKNPIWDRQKEVFDPHFYAYPTLPPDMGIFKVTLPEEPIRWLRCHIKTPSSQRIVLPYEMEPFWPIIRHAVENECHLHIGCQYYAIHVTVEHTYVQQGQFQRIPGWHVDGYQGGLKVPRHLPEHSYLWSSVAAPDFCIQPFFVHHLDPSRHNIFDALIEQAREASVYHAIPEHMYFIDPYAVHRSTSMRESGWRTFIRITFSTDVLEDSYNTVNESLDLPLYPPRLDVRDRFTRQQLPLPYDYWGLNLQSSVSTIA